MKKINLLILCSILALLYSCKKDTSEISEDYTGLEKYLHDNEGFQRSTELIACAASQPITEPDFAEYPISVFFRPITGAYDFKYFECTHINVDIFDYSKFIEKQLPNESVLNGYLWRFKNNTITEDVWGIVTYKVGNTIHICRAIRIKHYTKTTQFAPELVTITDSLTFPRFSWSDGVINENAIYFQVVSDTLNNLISGTYTYDKYFKFYNLSNVVLNIRDVNPAPQLLPLTKYNFMLMSVSEDNWVNLVGMKSFTTQ